MIPLFRIFDETVAGRRFLTDDSRQRIVEIDTAIRFQVTNRQWPLGL